MVLAFSRSRRAATQVESFFRDLSIQAKFLAGMAFLILVAAAAGWALSFGMLRDVVEHRMERELNLSTAMLADMVQTAVDVSIRNRLQGVAEKNLEAAAHFHDEARQGRITLDEAKARAAALFRDQQVGKTGYIYVLDSHGRILHHPEPEVLGENVSDHAFVQEQLRRKHGYLEYAWRNPDEASPRDKVLYMTYYAPWDWIIAASAYIEEFDAMVDPADFSEKFLGVTLGDSGYPFLIDESGKALIHPELAEKELVTDYLMGDDEPLLSRILGRDEGVLRYHWRNPSEAEPREKVLSFKRLPTLEWYVASSSYLEEFEEPVTRLKIALLLGIMPFAALALLVSAGVARSITHPLRSIMTAFSAGAKGDFTVRIARDAADEAGELARYFNIFMARMQAYEHDLKTEIAERVHAEASLRASETRYRLLFESMDDGFALYEALFFENSRSATPQAPVDFRFLEVNPAFAALVSARAETLTGKTIREVTPLAAPDITEQYEQVVRSGKAVRVERFSKTLDKFIRVTGYIPEKGYFATLVADITESKYAEEEMRRARNFVRSIIESMPSALVALNSEGRITQWNQEAEKLLGVTSTEALGQRLVDLAERLPPERDPLRALFAEASVLAGQAMKTARPARSELDLPTLRSEDVGGVRLELLAFPLRAAHVEGAVLRVDDVTERTRMQELVIQAEKMRTVSGLAAGMAHEINNPLGAVVQGRQNVSRRLLEDIPANHNAAAAAGVTLESLRDYVRRRKIDAILDDIQAAGQRASDIVRNMLEFSHSGRAAATEGTGAPAGAGAGSSARDVLMDNRDVNELVRKAVALAASDYDLKKRYDFSAITLEYDLAPEGAVAPCASMEIEQVLFNLLKNAAQALLEQPAPNAKPVITLRTRQESETVRIEVADNGPGMDEATRSRIFEPFYTTKPPGQGAGLGLSVAYFIITQHHHGTMEAFGAPGAGARLVITLPRTRRVSTHA